MCPDEELLSAYLDGEVASPWKERIEQRLTEIPECDRKLQKLAAVHHRLLRDPMPDIAASQQRVWQRLCNLELRRPRVPLWRRRIVVPLPLAAAAASLVLLLAAALLWHTGRATVGPTELPVSASEIDGSIRVGDIGIDDLLRIINEADAVSEIQVRLPEGARFDFIGEPQLIRAADFRLSEPLLVPHLRDDALPQEE